jgi:hypothetical protein
MSTAIATTSALSALQKTSPVQAAPAVRGGQDPRPEKQADDGAAAKPAASAAKPVINSLGQLLGQQLNVKA